MAIQVQFRRGTTSQHSTFTGAAGEITVDTDKETAVIHDGSTAGGFPLAKESGVASVFTAESLQEDYDALSGTTPTINANNGGAFSLTMTGNTTFTFSSVTSGRSVGFVLELTGNGGTVTWPSSVDWAAATPPDVPASGETDILVFWTRNGGTTWYGARSIDAAA